MTIAIVLPRGMHFGPEKATAIDLCVYDFVRSSVFFDETVIFCGEIDHPFDEVASVFVPQIEGQSHHQLAKHFVNAIKKIKARLVVVHQHLPIASEIARLLHPLPVLLHKHSFARNNGRVSKWRHERGYARFQGTIWVSDTARNQFVKTYPALKEKAITISNSLDCASWHPAPVRDQTVLVVGRASKEKGILQAAQGLVDSLLRVPDWKARFILSRYDGHNDYFDSVCNVLKPLGQQVLIETDQPHKIVKKAFETAAIALVPSTGIETFGRTALEAMAGGAALISSTRGGLGDVVSRHALTLDEVSPQTISCAVKRLILSDQERRENAIQGLVIARQHFDLKTTSALLDNFYRRFLKI